jgi:hypothetical protein
MSFSAITLCVAPQLVYILLSIQSGNFWIHPRNIETYDIHFAGGSVHSDTESKELPVVLCGALEETVGIPQGLNTST